MKYSITLLLLSVCSFLYSQTKTFENIKNMNLHSVGAFVDDNGVVKDNVQLNSQVEWFEVFPAEFGVVTVGEFE